MHEQGYQAVVGEEQIVSLSQRSPRAFENSPSRIERPESLALSMHIKVGGWTGLKLNF